MLYELKETYEREMKKLVEARNLSKEELHAQKQKHQQAKRKYFSAIRDYSLMDGYRIVTY